MAGFVEDVDRSQATLFPDRLEDYIGEDNPVRVVDAFVDALDLRELGFARAVPTAMGRPGYHLPVLLKLYVYGYLNRIPSSRRLEREAARNVELMWLTGRLAPDHKTIADFRRDNAQAIRKVCAQFVLLCRRMGLFGDAVVAIDGSKFKAVSNRDQNFTAAKMQRRLVEIEAVIARYMAEIDGANASELGGTAKVEHLADKLGRQRSLCFRAGTRGTGRSCPGEQRPSSRSSSATTSGRGRERSRRGRVPPASIVEDRRAAVAR